PYSGGMNRRSNRRNAIEVLKTPASQCAGRRNRAFSIFSALAFPLDSGIRRTLRTIVRRSEGLTGHSYQFTCGIDSKYLFNIREGLGCNIRAKSLFVKRKSIDPPACVHI